MIEDHIATEEKPSRHTNIAWQIFAFWGPVAFMTCTLAWAISAYLIVREKSRAQVELARMGMEAREE